MKVSDFVQHEGKKFSTLTSPDEWWGVSFNPDIEGGECEHGITPTGPQTAIVTSDDDRFVLLGDYREAYAVLIDDGLGACLAFYHAQPKELKELHSDTKLAREAPRPGWTRNPSSTLGFDFIVNPENTISIGYCENIKFGEIGRMLADIIPVPIGPITAITLRTTGGLPLVFTGDYRKELEELLPKGWAVMKAFHEIHNPETMEGMVQLNNFLEMGSPMRTAKKVQFH